MKKILILALLITVAIGFYSCKNGDVDDPGMLDPAAFRVTLKIEVTSSVFHVEAGTKGQIGINVIARKNDGSLLTGSGYSVLLDQNGDVSGVFYTKNRSEGGSALAIPLQNGQGSADFVVDSSKIFVSGSFNITLSAVLMGDDGRLDNSLAQVYDTTPVTAVVEGTTYPDEEFRITGTVTGADSYSIYVTNGGRLGEIHADSGSFILYVPKGWTGRITPVNSSYTFNPSSYSVYEPVYSELNNVNFNAVKNSSTD